MIIIFVLNAWLGKPYGKTKKMQSVFSETECAIFRHFIDTNHEFIYASLLNLKVFKPFIRINLKFLWLFQQPLQIGQTVIVIITQFNCLNDYFSLNFEHKCSISVWRCHWKFLWICQNKQWSAVFLWSSIFDSFSNYSLSTVFFYIQNFYWMRIYALHDVKKYVNIEITV